MTCYRNSLPCYEMWWGSGVQAVFFFDLWHRWLRDQPQPGPVGTAAPFATDVRRNPSLGDRFLWPRCACILYSGRLSPRDRHPECGSTNRTPKGKMVT